MSPVRPERCWPLAVGVLRWTRAPRGGVGGPELRRRFLLADLGITQSHSRPHVSNDNPFSEAQFKTLKYRPDFPGRFTPIEAARVHCQHFFPWYNDQHRHTGLALHTPADIHYGTAEITREKRAGVLDAAYAAQPERFVRKPPRPLELPTETWINRPDNTEEDTQ